MPGHRQNNPLIRPLRDEHRKLQTAFSRLSAEQWSQPITGRELSSKDILALIIAHEQDALQTVEFALRESPNAAEYKDLAEFNNRVVADNRTRPVDELIEVWDQSYAKLIAAVSRLNRADLAPKGKASQAAGASIEQIIRENTFGFYAGCREKIESWLAKK